MIRTQPLLTKKLAPALSLNHFIQRQRVLALYRSIVRDINKIPSHKARLEMAGYARSEFERNKNVTSLEHIRYLISTGKTEADTMKRYVYEQAR